MRHGWTWLEIMRYVAIFSVVTVTIGVGLGVGAGLGAAQDGTPAANSTDTGEDIERIEYELEDVDIVSTEFENSTAIVTARYNDGATVAVTDSGSVKSLGSNSGAGVSFNTYSRGEGTYELRLPLQSDDELITVQQGDRMYAASGDRALIDIITNPANPQTVQAGAAGGGFGVLLASAFGAGLIKRKHENKYTEVLSEERYRVESGAVEGFWGTVKRWLSRHRVALVAIAGILSYLLAVRVGAAPSPTSAWGAMNDVQRVFTASANSTFVIGFIPAFVVLNRLWDPAAEFVFDIDARDVIDSAVGAKGGLQSLEDIEDADDVDDAVEDLEKDDITVAAVYRGSPDRVAAMRVSGEPAEVQTAGGPGHLVQDFDPKKNTAEGTWPGLADDFELARERSKIDSNREILEDYATVGRRIVGALPAIRAGADTSAVQAVDRKFAEATAIDNDPVDDIMDSAVSGTRFERFYSNDDNEEGDEYDEDNDVVNAGEDGGDTDE